MYKSLFQVDKNDIFIKKILRFEFGKYNNLAKLLSDHNRNIVCQLIIPFVDYRRAVTEIRSKVDFAKKNRLLPETTIFIIRDRIVVLFLIIATS